MKYKVVSAIIFLFMFTFASCSEDTLSETGTIKYLNLEGGFYGIIADNGENYDPVNLPNEFKQKDIRVEFEFEVAKDQVSFHMWGTLIEIISIRKIE